MISTVFIFLWLTCIGSFLNKLQDRLEKIAKIIKLLKILPCINFCWCLLLRSVDTKPMYGY